jgi:hypothetical protein
VLGSVLSVTFDAGDPGAERSRHVGYRPPHSPRCYARARAP